MHEAPQNRIGLWYKPWFYKHVESKLERLDLPLNEDWLRPGHFAHAVETGSTQADHLLAEGEEGPTAIVCAADNIAIGVIKSAMRSGRRIPEDLSVVGFDNMDFSKHSISPNWYFNICSNNKISFCC